MPEVPSSNAKTKLILKISHITAPIGKPTSGAIQNDVQARARRNRYNGKPRTSMPVYANAVEITNMNTKSGDGVDTFDQRYGTRSSGTASGARKNATICRLTWAALR
jgi:hypothetical protein